MSIGDLSNGGKMLPVDCARATPIDNNDTRRMQSVFIIINVNAKITDPEWTNQPFIPSYSRCSAIPAVYTEQRVLHRPRNDDSYPIIVGSVH